MKTNTQRIPKKLIYLYVKLKILYNKTQLLTNTHQGITFAAFG